MSHKKIVHNVRKFLKRAQNWVDKTPGVLNVSMNVGNRNIVLAEKKHGKC